MQRIGWIALWIMVIFNTGWNIYNHFKPKTGYIYIEKVYDSFKGKREIEKELKSIEAKQNGVLDTLKLSITALEEKRNGSSASEKANIQNQLDFKLKEYQRLVREFTNYNSEESQKHIDGLLKQINEYVKEYGKKNNYAYIFGAAGNGSLMYANETDDLSEDVIKFINKKYAGE